jgi:hypothetical protein
MSSTTTYEVISIEGRLATVLFQNPYYTGAHIVTRQRPVLDEDGQPTDEVETYEVDEDPNPHAVKQVVVPVTASGGVDQPAFIERLAAQACGVRCRMEAAKAAQAPPDLDHLVGFTTPSP